MLHVGKYMVDTPIYVTPDTKKVLGRTLLLLQGPWGLCIEVGLHTNSDLSFTDFPKPQLLLFIFNTDKVLGTEGAIINKIVF